MLDNKINHWCIICGTGYHACNSCDEVKNFKPWRAFTDTIEHHKIKLVLDDYAAKIIDDKQAKEMLEKCDLTGYEDFVPHIANLIKRILACDDQTDEVEHSETVDVATLNDKENTKSEIVSEPIKKKKQGKRINKLTDK